MARRKSVKSDEPEIILQESNEILDERPEKRKYTKRKEKDHAIFGDLLTMGINGLAVPLDSYCQIEPAGLSEIEKNNLAFSANIFYEASDRQRINQAMGKVSTGLLLAMIAAVFLPRVIAAYQTMRARNQQKVVEG